VENDFPAIDEINLIDDVATAFSCSRQKVVVVLNIGGVNRNCKLEKIKMLFFTMATRTRRRNSVADVFWKSEEN
jgi:hypothetical protein